MNPPSPSKYPNRDGLPLSQLSPERVNGRVAKMDEAAKQTVSTPFSSPIRRKPDESSFFNPGIPQSPSLPEITSVRSQFRMNTDVSGLVKRFEHLDVRDREAESLERRRKQEEALSRASIAREEAEAEAKKCKEELRAQKKEYEECKSRERKACRRIEILMDEMDRAKDQWSSQSSVYEKEIRRARKEAFKSSSAVLKYQEESKRSGNEASVLRTKLDLADRKASKSEEEKFTAEYQLVAVQEELEKLRANLRIAEEEREQWKRSLEEEQIVRIAAQGAIALPEQTHDDLEAADDERPAGWNENTTRQASKTDVDRSSLADIRKQMMLERRRRNAAEGLAEFLQLECHFNCCRCSAARPFEAHRAGEANENDAIAQATGPQSAARDDAPPDPQTDSKAVDSNQQAQSDDAMQLCDNNQPSPTSDEQSHAAKQHSTVVLQQSLTTSSIRQIQMRHENDTPIDVMVQRQTGVPPRNDAENDRPTTPSSDQGSWREVSKTTTVPMHFTPSAKHVDSHQVIDEQAVTPSNPQPLTTSTEEEQQQTTKSYPFDREAALAAIEKRRRAKSFAQNGTPKRPVIGRTNDRRDISAPAITG